MPRRQQQDHGQDQGVQGVQGDLFFCITKWPLLTGVLVAELRGQDDAEGEQLDDGRIQLLVGPVH